MFNFTYRGFSVGFQSVGDRFYSEVQLGIYRWRSQPCPSKSVALDLAKQEIEKYLG
jgi:hypothetical protein